MSLEESVRASLAARERPDPRDAAAADLALLYAQTIDKARSKTEVLTRLGPKLFAVLASLGLTLEARRAKNPAEKPDDQPEQRGSSADPIDELEQRRAGRAAR